MSNPLHQLVELSPEQIESLFEQVYSDYNQPFSIVSVNGNTVWVELEDGRRVREEV